MALSALPAHRRRNIVYGKTGSNSKYSALLSDDDGDSLGSKSTSRVGQKRPSTTQEPAARSHNLKRPRPHAKAVDTFDVPSSDEDEEFMAEKAAPVTFKFRRPLVDDTAREDVPLAPWEKGGKNVTRVAQNGSTNVSDMDAPSAQLFGDMERERQREGKNEAAKPALSSSGADKKRPSPSSLPVENNKGPVMSSAVARLAARRAAELKSGPPSPKHPKDQPSRMKQKRPAASSEERVVSHKRSKVTGQKDGDITMEDRGSTPGEAESGDVFDFPDSDGDTRGSSKLPKQTVKPVKNNATKRVRSIAQATRRPTQTSTSAPARLHEMVPTDSESPEAPTRSPTPNDSRIATPMAPSTPPSGSIEKSAATIKAAGTMTPKQRHLWDRLLPDKTAQASPSALPMKRLSIADQQGPPKPALQRTLTKSKSDVGRRRTRLVDRLKPSAPTSAEEADEDVEASIVGDVPMKDQERHSVDKKSQEPSQQDSPQNSQTTSKSRSSQSRGISAGGPKITYTSARSFLPEDSLEDELMLGLVSELPKPSKTSHSFSTKAAPTSSQKTAFDMDDSDDDMGSGRLRTIHELRAAGRNISTLDDIDGLIRDIENHNQSNRSRRRSALLELATKLTDKTVAERFTGHSFELQLVAECSASPDNISDFALAAALALLSTADLSEHSISAMKERGVMTWLARMLVIDKDVTKIAKERSSNMSKAALASFVEFVGTLKAQTQVWDASEAMMTILTPRTVALKALEQLVKKVRRSGDKDKLLGAEQVALILPSSASDSVALLPSLAAATLEGDGATDLETSISLLELLSTSSVPFQWPKALVTRIAEILPLMTSASLKPRNVLFLTLRLCLNLTNVDAGNCDALSTPSVVNFLLKSVQEGFAALEAEEHTAGAGGAGVVGAGGEGEVQSESRAIALDLLVLAMGLMINLAEHSDSARVHARNDPNLLTAQVRIFQQGKTRMLEAESVEESITNVAFGYLAVMLANLCLNADTRVLVAKALPKGSLGALVEAVEEFVLYHQKVDMMHFDGEEGGEVWGAFTEKLRAVLERLRGVAGHA